MLIVIPPHFLSCIPGNLSGSGPLRFRTCFLSLWIDLFYKRIEGNSICRDVKFGWFFVKFRNLRILPHQLPAPGYNLSVKEFPILYAPHFGLWDLTTKTYLPLWQEIIYRSFLSFIILHFNIYIPYLHTKRKPYLNPKWLMDAVIFAMI